MRVAALKSQYDNKQQQLERELSEARKRLQALEKQMTIKQVRHGEVDWELVRSRWVVSWRCGWMFECLGREGDRLAFSLCMFRLYNFGLFCFVTHIIAFSIASVSNVLYFV